MHGFVLGYFVHMNFYLHNFLFVHDYVLYFTHPSHNFSNGPSLNQTKQVIFHIQLFSLKKPITYTGGTQWIVSDS